MGDYKNAFLIVGVIFPLLAAVAVILRFKARRLAKQKCEADDWLALAALIFSWGWTIIVLLDTRLGNLGGHLQFDEDGIPILGPWYHVFSLTNYVMVVVWNPTVGITKLSIAFLYKRIFATYAFRMVAWGTIVLLIAWTAAFTLVGIFPCIPVSHAWSTEDSSNCVNFPAIYTAGVASNVATDFIVLVIPIYNVWCLHMPMRRKIAVSAIFALGSFVIVTGVIRLVLLVRAYGALENSMSLDVTYQYSPPILWTVVELNLGVSCICLPLMRPVWRASMHSPLVSRLLRSLTKSTSYRSFDKADEAELGVISGQKAAQNPAFRPPALKTYLLGPKPSTLK